MKDKNRASFPNDEGLLRLHGEDPSPVSPNPYRVLRKGEKPRVKYHCVGKSANPLRYKLPSHMGRAGG